MAVPPYLGNGAGLTFVDHLPLDSPFGARRLGYGIEFNVSPARLTGRFTTL